MQRSRLWSDLAAGDADQWWTIHSNDRINLDAHLLDKLHLSSVMSSQIADTQRNIPCHIKTIGMKFSLMMFSSQPLIHITWSSIALPSIYHHTPKRHPHSFRFNIWWFRSSPKLQPEDPLTAEVQCNHSGVSQHDTVTMSDCVCDRGDGSAVACDVTIVGVGQSNDGALIGRGTMRSMKEPEMSPNVAVTDIHSRERSCR